MATSRFPSASWAPMQAPTLEDFEAMADEAFRQLPDSFRTLCGTVIIRIEDFPDDEVIEAMELETPFDILGLFHGQGLTEAGAMPETGQGPNMVWLYRRPILDYWAENEETLGAVITHVLVHEIGHHFGLSDADMEKIEAAAG
ncbi:MAG: metallopeptidase family protein [Beijerinckiaceae bacterium]|nr:metallopeptidase family protein [Beijerinckiaceae bacterium]